VLCFILSEAVCITYEVIPRREEKNIYGSYLDPLRDSIPIMNE